MRRAFLSHSTDDKVFVDEVAAILGRPRTHVDRQSFAPGEDFRDAIRRTLDDSAVFVFFVSARSLRSSWCKFELDEAEQRELRGSLRSSVAVFIDGEVDAQALPAWLARVKAIRHNAPQQTARFVEGLLAEALPESRRPFIGRLDDLQRGNRKLSTEPLPRIVVASGLEGIGRRAFLRRLVADALDLQLGPFITIPETGTLEDLFVGSLASTALLARDETEQQIEAFRALPVEEQTDEIAGQLALLTQQGSAPCIIDRGAMLDGSGAYLEPFASVLRAFLRHRDSYVCLTHLRSPTFRHLEFSDMFFERRLRPLEQPDAQVLISRLLRAADVQALPEQTERLAESSGGYPPAAYFIVSQVEDYGLSFVLNDRTMLDAFSEGRFGAFLRGLPLSDLEREILTYLASEVRLPIAGIATALDCELKEVVRAVGQLVDLSLLELTDDEYAVTSPIETTVRRTQNQLNRQWYEDAFARLERDFWSEENALPPISIVDATLRAGLRIGRHRTGEYGSLVRPSLLIRAAEEMYHARDYLRALEYVDRAAEMGGKNPALVEVQLKSLAQLGRFSAARSALREYREFGERRQHYLAGFIERKAGNHDRACSCFQRGYAANERSRSLLRDYADSLLRTGAVEDARLTVGEALERDSDSVYLLDLAARIEIVGGTASDAEAALNALEAVDTDKLRIAHRRASFLLHRRGTSEAIRAAIKLATKACERQDAPLEAYVILARCLIKGRQWERVEQVRAVISRKRKGTSRLILERLECEAAIQRKDWRQAERVLPDRTPLAARRRLQLEILELKAADRHVLLTERAETKAEITELRGVLGDAVDRPMADDYELVD